MKSKLEFFQTLFAVISAGIAIVFAIRYETIKKEIENIQASTNLRQDTIEFRDNLRFKIYDQVSSIYTLDSSKRREKIQLLSVLVTHLLADDGKFQAAISSVITNSDNTPQRTIDYLLGVQSAKQTFDNKEFQLKNDIKKTTNSTKIILIDIFYIEDFNSDGNAEKQASSFKKSLENSKLYTTRIIRLLPTIVNARSGYNIRVNTIRYNEDELDDASNIGKILRDSLSANISLSLSHQNTPNYISLFCTGR